MADELIDILNANGVPTGEIVLKSKAHKDGLFHSSVHIWFYNRDGEILLQKRAHNKDTYPSLWDISVAGHIGTGESPDETAVREVEEEIGLKIEAKNLVFLEIRKSQKKPTLSITDNEFHYIYICLLKEDIDSLNLQEEEVAELQLMPLHIFEQEINHDEKQKKYVPHDMEYYNFIIQNVKKLMND